MPRTRPSGSTALRSTTTPLTRPSRSPSSRTGLRRKRRWIRRGRSAAGPGGPLGQDGQVLPLPALGRLVDPGREQPVVVHDHLDPGQLTELPQLGRGEPDVLRPAADQHVHVGDRAGPQRRQHRIGHVGAGHLLGRPGQHPGHVQRDVAGADDRDPGRVEQRVEADLVGVPAVPADERAGAEGPVQLLPRHAEPPVHRAAGGVDDRVEVLAQRLDRHPALADVHVAEELHVGGGPVRSKGCCSTRITDFIFTWSGATP